LVAGASANDREWHSMSPTQTTNAGDLQMVTLWTEHGFVVQAVDPGPFDPPFVLTESCD
jgi:hypothetical protein